MPAVWYLNRVATSDERPPPRPGMWLTVVVTQLFLAFVMVALLLVLQTAWGWLALLPAALSLFKAAVASWRFRVARRRRRRLAP